MKSHIRVFIEKWVDSDKGSFNKAESELLEAIKKDQPKSAGVWVKASERLPLEDNDTESGRDVLVRDEAGNRYFLFYYCCSEGWEFHNERISFSKHQFNQLEWLDETQSTPEVKSGVWDDWISIENKKPAFGEYCLVYSEECIPNIVLATYQPMDKTEEPGRFMENNWSTIYGVTHWKKITKPDENRKMIFKP